MDWDYLEVWQKLFLGILALALGAVLVWIFLYRDTAEITVQSRWWVYEASVKYDTRDCGPVTKSEYVCTGSGDSRTCSYESNTTIECETNSHTRCRNVSIGNTWPPSRPELCYMYPGDYVSEYVSCHTAYLMDDAEKEDLFSCNLWDCMESGNSMVVERNVFGTIVGIP